MKFIYIFNFFVLAFTFNVIVNNSIHATEGKNVSFAARQEVQNFINYMASKHDFDKKQLNLLFSKYNSNQDVLQKISNPAEKLPWARYKQLLISPERIKKGKEFIAQNQNFLIKAEQKFGVPKEIIAAVLGVESFYGNISGTIPVIQSLATLSFDYPPREKFFKQELEHFLLLTREEKLDPGDIKGSYAGAMSPAQFISSSYRSYAIDFADLGTKDLNHLGNAIGSIANYFLKNGWKSKQPIAQFVKVNQNNNIFNYIDRNLTTIVPKYPLQQFKELPGIEFKEFKKITDSNEKPKLNHDHSEISKTSQNNSKSSNDLVALMEFIDEKENKEYWLGYHNFCVITKYNRSVNYAMAIYLLSEQLRESL